MVVPTPTDDSLKLSEKVNFDNADVFMNPYLPKYVECEVNIEDDGKRQLK